MLLLLLLFVQWGPGGPITWFTASYCLPTFFVLCLFFLLKKTHKYVGLFCLSHKGLLLACFYWGYPLLQIPGGGLSDRVGGDKVITVCALVWSTLTFITPLVPYAFSSNEAALTAMIIIRFLQGMSQSEYVQFNYFN